MARLRTARVSKRMLHGGTCRRALLTRGCEVSADGQFFPLELQPAGDRIVCTPTVSGLLLPFNVSVTIGEPVAITWDSELSRYIVSGNGEPAA